MNANFKTRTEKCIAIAFMPLALLLAGCSGTLQTRGATPDDTFYRWKPQMETLPIEVHGGIEQLSSSGVAKQIPYGTTPGQYASALDNTRKLADAPRIVLYIDSGENLTGNAYCDISPISQSVSTKEPETHVIAAFCDGPRLIDLTTRNVQNDRIETDGMGSIVKSMKLRLLYGLPVSDEVDPVEYGNG